MSSSVTVIESDEINERIPSSVAKILSDVPGIRVSESGIERIRIRGESFRWANPYDEPAVAIWVIAPPVY